MRQKKNKKAVTKGEIELNSSKKKIHIYAYDLFPCVADVFGECYSNSEDRAYALLVRRTKCWSKSTVLNLATEADAKSFFAHDGVQVGRKHAAKRTLKKKIIKYSKSLIHH